MKGDVRVDRNWNEVRLSEHQNELQLAKNIVGGKVDDRPHWCVENLGFGQAERFEMFCATFLRLHLR